MNEAIEVGVAEGLPRGFDDVLTDSDRGPGAEAVGGLDEHPYGRIGAVTLVENPYL